MRKLSVKDLRANLADLLNIVYYTKEPVVVERKGKRVAVLISPEQFDQMRQADEQAWKVIRRVQERNADKSAEEVERDVARAVEEVRQELYDREKSTSRSH